MQNQKKGIAILGSTGSIGTQALEVISSYPEYFDLQVLTAGSNVELLIEQSKTFKPNTVVIANEEKYNQLREALEPFDIHVYAGQDALCQVVESQDVSIVLTALVGYAGLIPTIKAIEAKKTIALANKETLVVAGELIQKLSRKYQVDIYPVDSEHSAIFQCLIGEEENLIEKIYLTASGGPFRGMTIKELLHVTKEKALRHPNWDMGAKISVDSATMMNKGLELIEAYYLFGLPEDRIDVLVHPQSIIHSMVSYVDGSVLAQLGSPDMRTPISYALAWPQRMAAPSPRLDLGEIATLTFEAPDSERFPALRLARAALKTGGSAPTILNASNEEAVAGFLAEKVGFLDIPRIVEETLENMPGSDIRSVDDVLSVDAEARRVARDLMSRVGLQV